MFKLKKNGRAHSARNEQQEYVGSEGKNVIVLEFMCGKKKRKDQCEESSDDPCKACQRSRTKI